MNRILRSQLPPNPRDLAVFDTTTGSSPGRTRWRSTLLSGLAFLLLFCSSILSFGQAANYNVTASAGTFVPITGGTVIQALGVVYDDAISSSQTINSFTFNGVAYTTMAINTNGWMSFGVSTTTTGYTPLSSAVTGGSAVISPFGRDQQGQATSEIRWQYLAGTNETVVQWLGVRTFGATGCDLNYQVRLNHTNNTIRFVYGSMTNGTNGTSPQVGIKSAIAAGVIGTNMNSLTIANVPAGTTCNWLNAVSSRVNNATMLITNANITCPSGTTFTFTPQGGATSTWVNPVTTFAAATGIGSNGATVSWTAPTNANAYNVQYRSVGSCAWTNFPGNPVAATTATLTGLTALTSYQVRVQPLNSTSGNTCRFSHPALGNATANSDGYTATGYFTTLAQQCSGTPNVPVASLTGASSICANQTKAMTATGVGTDLGLNLQWQVSNTPGGPYTNVSGGTGATTASYTSAALSPGTYYYVLTSTCANSLITSTSNELTLVVNALPTVSLSAPNGGAFCGTQLMTASGASTYAWTPSASLSAATGSSVYFTGTSSVTVNVTGTDVNGCTAAASQAVVYTAPTPITMSSSVPNFCGTGGTTTISATSSAPYTYTFAALDGAVLSNATASSVDATVSATSAIRVTGYDAATGCSAQAVYSVGLYPLPSASVTTTASGVCPGTPATINSGLSAGNFSVTCITHTWRTAPATAFNLALNGVKTAPPGGFADASLDDGKWGDVPIGFNFNYFGTPSAPVTFNKCNVGTNGVLNFGPYSSFNGTQFQFPNGFPSTLSPLNTIGVLATDFYFNVSGSVKYWTEGYAPNRIFVLEYNNGPGWTTDGVHSAQCHLYETTGIVEIHIKEATGTGTYAFAKTIGLQDGTGTVGAVAPVCGLTPPAFWNARSATILASNPQGWRFSPPANYLTVWNATDANGSYGVTTNVDGSTINAINGFTATVAPLITTTYSIQYTNATTYCSNALTPAQVTMLVLGNVAPTGVSATSTVTTACPSANIPLSTSYTGSLDGLTFQWQVSTDGGANWNNITGATASTYTATQTVASSYRVGIASCGGTVEYTSPVAIALTGFLDCYCTSSATSTADEEISNVTVGTVLNNSSTCTTLAPGPGSVLNQYSNYTTLPASNLLLGVAYPISVTQTSCGGAYGNIIGAWIDYNHNGLFTDAGEQVLTGTYTTGNQTSTGTFTVPATALSGQTRMRVVVVESAVVNPCGTYTWGETEDYFVNILGPCDPALFIPPLASADDPDATVCGTQTSQLTAFDFNGVANPIYMWYDAATGGTLLQNSTSNFYTPAPITATTTWYVATNTGTCITDRFPVTLNWVAPAAITATNSNPVFCGSTGSPTDLSVTSSNAGYAYTWTASPSTGSGLTAGTTGATVSAVTPTVNGVYTYTVNANDASTGCTTSATTTVGFYSPLSGTATVTQPTVCGGNGSVNFAVNGSGTVFTSDFSSSTLPSNVTLAGNSSAISGGVLRVNSSAGSQNGGILVTNTTGVAANDFQIDFDYIATAGSASPADGFSYSYGPDVVALPTGLGSTVVGTTVAPAASNAENGSGTALKLSFDAYTNGANTEGVYLMYNAPIWNQTPTSTGVIGYVPDVTWRATATTGTTPATGLVTHVTIKISSAGLVQLFLNNGSTPVISGTLPASYLTADKSTWKHAFAGRTGLYYQGQFIDNLDIHYNNFYEYSVDNGSTWTTTTPVAVPAPSSVQNVARYTSVPSCSVNLGTATVAFPVAAPTGVTGGSTCLNGTTLNVSANGAPVNGVQTLSVPLGTSVTLPGAALAYTSPYGTLTLNGNVNLPAGATVTGANLVINGLTANGFTWLSEVQVSLSGVSAISNQVLVAAPAGNTSPTNGGPYTIAASIPSGSGAVTCVFLNTYTGSVTMASVNLVITYSLPSAPVWFNAATGGSVLGTGSTFNVIGTSYLPNASAPFNGTVYAASVVTNGASTCYSATVPATVTVGQPLNVSIAAVAPVTQTFTLATNYSVAPGATQTLTGTIAIPAGATVTSTVLQVNGVTSTNFTWGNDVTIAMSGASTVASQVVANVNGSLTNAGPYNYTASNVVAPGGDVYVTFTHSYPSGGAMDFGSIAVLVTYTAPVTGSVCPGTPITLNATTTGGGANPTYQWNLNGSAISGATAATYVATPAAGSVYTVTVVDACNPSGVTSSSFTPSLFTVTAGTITGPSAILVNDFTAPIPGAGTWTIAGQNAGSTIQWSYGTAPAGPYATIAGATGSSQTLYASGSAGTVYLTATTTTTDGCSIQANVVTVVLGNAIDTPCTAAPITFGNQGGQEWSTAAASSQTGETYGPGLTNPGNTIWFSFVAPASGHVSIVTTSSTFWDNYITLFSGSSCSNIAGLTQIGYNDDANGTAQAALNDVKCLTPGATYYIQMRYWSSANTVGQAGIILTDLGNTAPVINGLSSNITLAAASGTCAATATWAAPTTTDDQACAVTLTSNFNSGASFPVGVTTVTYTATDAQGLITTGSFTVTVTDSQLPTITAPSNVTVNANSSCNATGVALGTPVTADNCTVASVTNNAPATFPLGVTTVTWTVTDGVGNTATATQTVTVVDVTNPTITAPANVSVNANSSCNATGVALGTPVTADNCSVASVTSNAPATFPLGVTTVTWTVTDGAGLTATATQTVTVVDATNPTITAPANVSVNANSSCNATGVALGTPVTADNCSVASVTSNAPATFPLGVTTVTWTVTDGSGNTATATQTVTVVDAANPTITAPANVTVTAAMNTCTATATLGSAVTADNCGVASTTNNAPATFPIGTTTVTWTVTDNAGNTATATQTVTVNVNPGNLWYVDADGDGYGAAGASVLACSQPAGYAANTTDCNDALASVNPGAFEICGNSIDDNCNGQSDEGCQFPGENPSNATSITPSVWPACTLTNGTLVGASISGAAQTICLTGEDKWHQFVATSEGVSIVVNSTAADIVIELQTAAGVLVAQENAVSGLGGEILNHYGLTAGQVYKVGVRNYNSALGTGTYSICVKMLKRGGCDYGPGPYTLCQYFKATWAGATGTGYTFTFTGLTGPAAGNVYTRTQNSDICVLSSVLPTLPYGSTYNVLITNTYTINNGAGVAETISVPALAPCSMSTSVEPTTALRTTDQCAAGPRFRGAIVASLPWVCGATNWRWEFTELDASGNPVGLPITVNRGAASNYINLGTVLQLQYGKTYSVRTAPILPYTGTNYQWGASVCMSIVGTAGMVADGGQANQQVVRMETTDEVNMSLYPNPTHGSDVNINLSGVTSENVQIRVVDAMGRQVWSNRYSVNGVLNTNITFERPLANGLYMVEAIFNGEVQTQRMMVQK